MKKKIENTEQPELYIDGEKIKFHYNRKERLAMQPRRYKSEGFFSKKNRYLHIQMIALFFIFIMIIVLSKIIGNQKSYDFNNFRITLSEKRIKNSPNIDFKVIIKNLKKSNNIIDENDRNISFHIKNDKDELIFEKNFFIEKKYFASDEKYEKLIIVTQPEKGDYSAELYFKDNLDKSLLNMKFTVKD